MTPDQLAAELERWADARDRINVRREKQATETPDREQRRLDSTALHEAATYLRVLTGEWMTHHTATRGSDAYKGCPSAYISNSVAPTDVEPEGRSGMMINAEEGHLPPEEQPTRRGSGWGTG